MPQQWLGGSAGALRSSSPSLADNVRKLTQSEAAQRRGDATRAPWPRLSAQVQQHTAQASSAPTSCHCQYELICHRELFRLRHSLYFCHSDCRHCVLNESVEPLHAASLQNLNVSDRSSMHCTHSHTHRHHTSAVPLSANIYENLPLNSFRIHLQLQRNVNQILPLPLQNT